MDDAEFATVVTEEPGYLRLTITGRSTSIRRLNLLKRVAAEAESRRANRVLVDSTANTGELTMIDRYEFGKEAARALGMQVKLAVVLRPERADPFAETVAANRGGNLGVFGNEREALEWLIGPAVGPAPG